MEQLFRTNPLKCACSRVKRSNLAIDRDNVTFGAKVLASFHLTKIFWELVNVSKIHGEKIMETSPTLKVCFTHMVGKLKKSDFFFEKIRAQL